MGGLHANRTRLILVAIVVLLACALPFVLSSYRVLPYQISDLLFRRPHESASRPHLFQFIYDAVHKMCVTRGQGIY